MYNMNAKTSKFEYFVFGIIGFIMVMLCVIIGINIWVGIAIHSEVKENGGIKNTAVEILNAIKE